jgi:hypothetical protein
MDLAYQERRRHDGKVQLSHDIWLMVVDLVRALTDNWTPLTQDQR